MAKIWNPPEVKFTEPTKEQRDVFAEMTKSCVSGEMSVVTEVDMKPVEGEPGVWRGEVRIDGEVAPVTLNLKKPEGDSHA